MKRVEDVGGSLTVRKRPWAVEPGFLLREPEIDDEDVQEEDEVLNAELPRPLQRNAMSTLYANLGS